MARPIKKRKICGFPENKKFGPLDLSQDNFIEMSLDEYEVIRLIDYENLNQEEASRQMDVARTTVQSIYKEAREKLALSLVEGLGLKITGGHYRMCQGRGRGCKSKRCMKKKEETSLNLKLAVPVRENNIHSAINENLARTNYFLIYDLASDNFDFIENEAKNRPSGAGLASAQLLADRGVDIILAPKCGEKAARLLDQAKIKIFKNQGDHLMDNIENLKNDRLEKL